MLNVLESESLWDSPTGGDGYGGLSRGQGRPTQEGGDWLGGMGDVDGELWNRPPFGAAMARRSRRYGGGEGSGAGFGGAPAGGWQGGFGDEEGLWDVEPSGGSGGCSGGCGCGGSCRGGGGEHGSQGPALTASSEESGLGSHSWLAWHGDYGWGECPSCVESPAYCCDGTDASEGCYCPDGSEQLSPGSSECCPQEVRCGPDVTDWLLKQLNDNYDDRKFDDHFSIFGLRSGATFAVLVEASYNFNAYYDFSSDQPQCPLRCGNSVTICNTCYNSSVPEDLNYAVAGSPIFLESTLRAGAEAYSLAVHRRKESVQAHNTFTAGFEMIGWGWTDITRKEMCDVLAKHTGQREDQIHPKDCPICPNPGYVPQKREE